MKLEAFFEKFDQFADAPDAVEKMRELILESAIRGKLVSQDTRDEAASELLKRVARIQDGQSKKRAALAPVGDDAYLKLPTGWEWTRLGNTGRIFNGDSVSEIGKAELAKVAEGLPFIATKDVGYGRDALVYDNGLKVPLGDPRFKVARANAVLICAEGGSAGRKIGIADRDICFGNKLFANEVHEGIHHRYVFYIYQAPTFFKEFAARMTGIIGGIARSEFLSLPFPLPPLAEQKRIVAKVDELMALCDRLEAQQQEAEIRRGGLARASLARFADAPTPANLHFLFHPSYAIPPDDIRMSILTLSIQGLLVRQAPDGDHAADYLPKPTSLQISAFPDLPPRWTWSCVNETGRVDLGRQRAPQHHRGPNMRPYLRVQNVYEDRIDVSDVKTMNFTDTEFAAFALMSGDILLNEGQSYKLVGRPAIYRGEVPGACFQNTLVRYRANPFVLPEYALVVFRAYMRNGRFQQISKQTTNIAHLSAGRFAVLEFPLPPLAEQRRIVAKVEQLMALVGALETQLAASRATAAKLLSALVTELTKA